MATAKPEILVVEDSRTQLQALVHILESAGYAIITAASGKEALEQLGSRQPDLIISDVMMPEMDGYELCRRIKAAPDLQKIPVILLTYLSDTHDVLRGLEAGADNFIMKPVEARFLLTRVRRTLHAAPKPGACPAPEFPLQTDERIYCIRSGCEQMLEILLSTYETALQKNERLQAAQADLRAANEELEAFSYSVSHDLRTPLSVIIGFGDFLWEDYADVLDENGRKNLLMIRQSAEKMLLFIEDLLELSRAARAELQRQTIDLTAMLREIAAELRREDPDRRVDVHIETGMRIDGDPTLLRVAFENLLRNAWKFTSKKELARIEAGWHPGAAAILYYIRDNGAGFAMADAGKLFGSFRRLHSETDFPGTGLGLSIVQRVISRHGGTIRAEGEVDRGAAFYLTMPRT